MVNHQQNLPVFYDGPTIKMGFRLDLIVNNEVIIELKSVDALAPVHAK